MGLLTARNGELSFSVGTVHLHSGYNPGNEADRFLQDYTKESFTEGEEPTLFILLEPGLGYLCRSIKKRWPSTPIIVLHYSKEVALAAEKGALIKGEHIWSPDEGTPLHQFLLGCVDEFLFSGVKIVEWLPASRLFPSVAESVKKTLFDVINRVKENIQTTIGFGNRWVTNSIQNFLYHDHYRIRTSSAKAPVVIAASGPSLNDSIKNIKKYRDQFELWSLPSSLPLLQSENITPDLTVSTDGGYWASLHFNHFPESSCMAMPLLGALFKREAPLLLNQMAPVEERLLRQIRAPFPKISAEGSVAGTAVKAARYWNAPQVFFVGLDLETRGIQEHCKPHAFDYWLESRETRLTPLYTLSYSRVVKPGTTKAGGAYRQSQLNSYRKRFNEIVPQKGYVFRLNPSSVELPTIESREWSLFSKERRVVEKGLFERVSAPPLEERRSSVREMLDEVERGAQYLLHDRAALISKKREALEELYFLAPLPTLNQFRGDRSRTTGDEYLETVRDAVKTIRRLI